MRLTSGDSKRGSTHNITRSLIDEGSEDFINIEERLQEDTRISCRNAIASSLNNVSQSKFSCGSIYSYAWSKIQFLYILMLT
jgi:hypothetical protein